MVDYTALAGSLDLFELMVNYVAGGVLLSLVIWAIVIFVAGLMGRLTFQSIIIILISYAVTVGVGYVGALAAVPLFLWSLWYMVSGVINYFNNTRV